MVITLATAAPITVPATPKREATTADEAAARALAAICNGLSWGFGAGPGVRVGAAVGGVMGSGCQTCGREAGHGAAPAGERRPARLRRSGRSRSAARTLGDAGTSRNTAV